jgi:hypothetical protein
MDVLSTRGVSNGIEDIIKKAQKEIFLITPYLKIENSLFQRICNAGKRDVQITIVYGKTELKKEQFEKLKEIKNCTILFNKNLHAKVYHNEEKMVLTSMNLYDFSEVNNFELGMLILKNEKEFDQLKNEINLIISSSEARVKNEVCKTIKAIRKKIKEGKDFEYKNFPDTNISIDSLTQSKNGIIAFHIKGNQNELDELKNNHEKAFIKTIGRDYRFYWNNKKLSLYSAEDSKYSKSKETEYFVHGIETLNSLIKEHIVGNFIPAK